MRVRTRHLAKALEKKMKKRCWAIQDLADKAGVSYMCVHGFFNGRNMPSIENFLRMAKALDYQVMLYEEE